MKLIKYTVIMAIAAISTSCGSDDKKNTKVCVDKDGKIIEDRFCESNSHHGGMGTAFMWYYGARHLGLGQVATGGSYTPQPGVNYTTRRSGFGGSSRSGSSS